MLVNVCVNVLQGKCGVKSYQGSNLHTSPLRKSLTNACICLTFAMIPLGLHLPWHVSGKSQFCDFLESQAESHQ